MNWTKPQEDFAIVLLNYNGKNWLELFLSDLIQNSPPQSVYLIDNGSQDDSINYATLLLDSDNIIHLDYNLGFAGGYNKGLQFINKKYFCLLNTDVLVKKDWFQGCLQLLSENDTIGAVQPKILDYYDQKKFEYAGAAGGTLSVIKIPGARGRNIFNCDIDSGQYNEIAEIDWASGCALFIRKDDFYRIGGFDEVFFAHQEEIDLCLRLKQWGKRILYCPDSQVYHAGGGTLKKSSSKKTYLNFRNNLLMIAKNTHTISFILLLLIRLPLDGLLAIYLGFKNGISHFFAVIRAHFTFYALLPYAYKRKHEFLQLLKNKF